MIQRLCLVLSLCLCAPAAAQDVAEQAQAAAKELQTAVDEMQRATTARDRVSALTQTIGAYERGLAAMRDNLRQAKVREAALLLQFNAERGQMAQLLGALGQLERTPAPLLLLHPAGPMGTARSGMILADVTPAVQARVARLQSELTELRDLRALQLAAGETLATGLRSAQEARTTLSQAISERTTLPRRFTEDPEELRRLLEGADTLDAFASGLSLDTGENGALRDFASAQGSLPLPALGTLLRRANEADAAGERRPGISIATRPRALVTAPWAGTIRYRGPLLDYGNVMILEPGSGYLIVLGGLGPVYGDVGDVIGAGAPLGLMGPETEAEAEFLAIDDEGDAVRGTQTLYIELRNGTEPVDPAPWFATTKD